MSFSVHTFEINPTEGNPLGFAFHESVGEGREVYFLARFPEGAENPKTVAEVLFSSIVETFESSKIENPYDLFESALKNANTEAYKHKKSLTETPEILVAFFDFHNLYLSQSGNAEAYLVRGGNVSQISEIPEAGDDLFLNILNGQVAVGDTILLSSGRILRSITASQLADIFARGDFGDAIATFRHQLSTGSDENLLISAVGIGKQDTAQSAGFLSKVVSRGKAALNSIPKRTLKEEIGDPLPEDVYSPEDTGFEEVDIPSSRMKVLTDLWKKIDLRNFQPKKNLVVITGAVLAVLIFGILLKGLLGYESEETAHLREQLTVARNALQEADSYLLQGENTQAKEFLTKAREAVQTVLNAKSKTFRSDAQFLLADLEQKQLSVEDAKKVQPQLLADLGVKNDNLETTGLIGLNQSLYAHDTRQVYKTVRNIVERGIPLSDSETVVAGAARTDQNTLLFLTDTPRIVEYKDGVITPMGTEDEAWKGGIDIKTYGRYAYLLDPVENQIWKYERRRSTYSGGVAYNQGADLSRIVSMTIDGSIYLLGDDGAIVKLFRGTPAEYDFRDLPSIPFTGKNLKLYTTPDLDFLYLLDPDNTRVLVFQKGDRFASYKRQIIYDIPDVRDFAIDDDGQKGSLLTKDKIYEFSF